MCLKLSIKFYSYHALLYPDINECSPDPNNICGLGTCNNIDDGNFYTCICQNGAMTTGTSFDGTLTCVGEYIYTSTVNKGFTVIYTLSIFTQISMSAHKLASVDLEPAVIMIMEDSMNVTVQMEQWLQDSILMAVSHVLVSTMLFPHCCTCCRNMLF